MKNMIPLPQATLLEHSSVSVRVSSKGIDYSPECETERFVWEVKLGDNYCYIFSLLIDGIPCRDEDGGILFIPQWHDLRPAMDEFEDIQHELVEKALEKKFIDAGYELPKEEKDDTLASPPLEVK